MFVGVAMMYSVYVRSSWWAYRRVFVLCLENSVVCHMVSSSHPRRLAKDSGFWNRIISLEARAMKRSKIGTQLYIPVIFIGYAILLGTVQ